MKLQHFDKFIIAAFIATLLCIAFKADAQRGMRVAGRTTIVNNTVTNNIDSSEVNTITYGLLDNDTVPQFTIGYLDYIYPGYTYSQKKTIRQANWESFQAACNWALTNNARVLLPPAPIEVHADVSESIVAATGKSLTIKGAGKEVTNLIFYPLVHPIGTRIIFDFDNPSTNLVLSDFSITAEKTRLETYNVTLRPGGVTNQIRIDDSNVLAATATNFVGKTVYATTDNVTLVNSYTVTNYNSATKTLTLGTNVTGGTDDAGLMCLLFAEDTPVDSIRAYGEYWRHNNIYNPLVYALSPSVPVDMRDDNLPQYFTLKNMSIIGFDSHIYASGDDMNVTIDNCYISAHITSIAMYSNFETDAHLNATNSTFEDNSCVIVGYFDGAYTATNYLGSTFYTHPNTQWNFANNIFKNNNGGTVRQYSASGNKPTPSNAISFITNCQWYNNLEYDVLTSQDMPSYYTNCSFAGSVYAHNRTNFVNCEFKGFVSSYDSNGNLKFKGCTFTSGVAIAVNQRSNYLEFESCTFTPNPNTYTFEPKVDELIIRNCKFLNNGVVSGTNPIFSYTYGPKFIIENCDFQDIDAYLFWRIGPEIPTYPNLNTYDKVLIRGCKFAFTPFNCNQVSIPGVNLIVEDCQFNWATAAYYGNYNIKARKQTYKRTLTGSTITLDMNYNHYFTDGTINKIAVPVGVDGMYYFTSTDTTIFTKYVYPGNTTSNLTFSDTLYPNQTVQLYYDATDVRSAVVSTHSGHVIATGNGTTKGFDEWGIFFSHQTTPIKRGTMVLTAGAVTLTDYGEGILRGSGGLGWIDYYRNMLVVYFDTAPGAGVPISVTYDYHTTTHQTGMWSKVE